jgi:Phospholipase_D-nuclease N-terminal
MTNDLLAIGMHAAAGPPRVLWAALLPVIILAVLFDVYCLVDVIRAKSVRRLPKGAWALIILLISAPWGGLAYLFLGRDRHHQGTQQP